MKTVRLALILAGVALLIVLVSQFSDITTKRALDEALETQRTVATAGGLQTPGPGVAPAYRQQGQPGAAPSAGVAPVPDAYAARQAELESKLEARMLELEEKYGEAAQANAEKDAQLAQLKEEMDVMDQERKMMVDKMVTEEALEKQRVEQSLTDEQRRVLRAVPVAAVTSFDQQYGFVSINAGEARGITEGSRLAIRRGDLIVAELMVRSTELNASIADVVRKDEQPESGDEIIAWPF